MGLFDTTADEESTKRIAEALKGVKSLQEWLVDVKKAMERHEPGRAFDIQWCSIMMEKALIIYNEVARCNGAVLVRAKEPSMQS